MKVASLHDHSIFFFYIYIYIIPHFLLFRDDSWLFVRFCWDDAGQRVGRSLPLSRLPFGRSLFAPRVRFSRVVFFLHKFVEVVKWFVVGAWYRMNVLFFYLQSYMIRITEEKKTEPCTRLMRSISLLAVWCFALVLALFYDITCIVYTYYILFSFNDGNDVFS